jgi:hypothetical protein
MLKAQEEEPPGDFHNHDEFLYFWAGLSLTTKPKTHATQMAGRTLHKNTRLFFH